MLPLKPKGADQEVMVSPFFAPQMFEILNLWEGFKVIDGNGFGKIKGRALMLGLRV